MDTISILVADDHTLVRRGIVRLLEDQPNLEVVGEAADGHEAVARAAELQPNVVLMDIGMPGMNGLEAAETIKQRYPGVQVLMLTVHDDEEYLFRALKAGASGYVLKEAETAELVMAIDAAHRGEVFLYPSIAQRLVCDYLRRVGEGGPEEQHLATLTDRQREVLQLVAAGCTNLEIAERLVISPFTVQSHRNNIMRKLDLHSRTELIKYAIRLGLTNADSS